MTQQFRLAVTTANFRQPLLQSLKTAISMGAQGVQLTVGTEIRPGEYTDTGRRQFLHQMSDLGLSVASLHLPTRLPLCSEERLEERLSHIRDCMQLAWQLKAGILTLRIGQIPEDQESREYLMLGEVMNDLARSSNHIGTLLAVIPTKDSPERMESFLGGVTHGLVTVDLDPVAIIAGGFSPSSALRTLHARVHHLQARDAVRDIDGSAQEVALGRGEVDWDEIVALLVEIPYRGWITVNRSQGDHRLLESSQALEYLTQVGYR